MRSIEAPLRGRGTNQWSPHTFLLVVYHWLGDGFPTIVLKGHDESLNLGEFERVHHKWAYGAGGLTNGPQVSYFPPRGLSLARAWISYNCFKGSWFERVHHRHKCAHAHAILLRVPTGQGGTPMILTYVHPRGLSLARRWLS